LTVGHDFRARRAGVNQIDSQEQFEVGDVLASRCQGLQEAAEGQDVEQKVAGSVGTEYAAGPGALQLG